MSKYTFREKLWLYEQMKGSSEEDQRFIVRLLIKKEESFTENSNGIFFDLERLMDETLEELINYYQYVKPLLS